MKLNLENNKYYKDENKFIEQAIKLIDNYNINLDDLIDIIKDRLEDY